MKVESGTQCESIAAASVLLALLAAAPAPMSAQTAPAANPLAADVDRLSAEINPQVVAWRRDFHKNPELGNRETRTAKIIADELRKLGFEVTTGVATTGVVGVLRGGRPGPVVALRSDMDALPVTEQVDRAVQVHREGDVERPGSRRDARVRSRQSHGDPARHGDRARAHEGSPAGHGEGDLPARRGRPAAGETGGAEQMVKENVLENPKVDAVFGLHVFPFPAGADRVSPGSVDGERRLVHSSRSRAARRTAPCRGAASIRSSSDRRS